MRTTKVLSKMKNKSVCTRWLKCSEMDALIVGMVIFLAQVWHSLHEATTALTIARVSEP